jgi:protein gp37
LKWNKKHAAEVASFGRYAAAALNAGKSFIEVAADKENMVNPLPSVFPSLCDWLDAEVPIEWLGEFLELIYRTPNLTWLLLTKRPENFRTRLSEVRKLALARSWFELHGFVHQWLDRLDTPPPENVWLGTSVEDQIRADERIPALLRIPAFGRFLSVEPLLGPVDLEMALEEFQPLNPDLSRKPALIDWVIVGGESGPGARPCNVDWVRSLVSQCKAYGVPVFVKQLGKDAVRTLNPGEYHPERPEGKHWPLFLNHPKGGDPAEWPDDLRVRQFPNFGGAR